MIQIDNFTFYNADCMDIMKTFKDNQFDLAIVDPPYGIGEAGQRNAYGDRSTSKWKNPQSQKYKTFNDSKTPNSEYFKELFRVSKNQIIWGGNYFTEYLPPKSGWIIWNKKTDIKEHLSMAELAWSSFDIKCNMFDWLWAGFKKAKIQDRIHPTEKPYELYEFIAKNYAKNGQSILDTHLGSASIALAVDKVNKFDNMNLSLTGIELDSDYFQAAIQRFKQNRIPAVLPFLD